MGIRRGLRGRGRRVGLERGRFGGISESFLLAVIGVAVQARVIHDV